MTRESRRARAQATTGSAGTNGSNGVTGATGATGQGYTFRGAFTGGTSYAAYDTVTSAAGTWVAILTNSDANLSDPAHWTLIAAAGATGATGAEGAAGATGPQGIQGATGAQERERGG